MTYQRSDMWTDEEEAVLRQTGANHPRAKLTDLQVRMFRALSACGFNTEDIKRECSLDVSKGALTSIKQGNTRVLDSDDAVKLIAEYELEIKQLKAQYNKLQKHQGDVVSLIRKLTTQTLGAISTAVKRNDTCQVYFCPVLKKFSIITKQSKRPTGSDANLIGVYAKGFDRGEVKGDILMVLGEAYGGAV